MQRSDRNRLIALFNERLVDGLCDIDFINAAILERQSLKYKGKNIDLSTEGVPELFDESGNFTDAEGAAYDANRIKGFLTDIIGEAGFHRLSVKERIIFEAVCNKILVDEELIYTNAILTIAAEGTGVLSNQEQAKLTNAHQDLTNVLSDAAKQVLLNLKTYLFNIPDLYPGAHQCTNLTEYLTYLRGSGIWNFYIPPSSSYIEGVVSRFFKNCPPPPHIMKLIDEIKIIVRNPDNLQENLSIWFDKLEMQAYRDLFDEEGNIHQALFDILPETALTRDDDKLKKLLLNAYFTTIISENVTPVLETSACREFSKILIKENRHGEEEETPVKAIITMAAELRNREIELNSFDEFKAKHAALSEAPVRPYKQDAPRVIEPVLEPAIPEQPRPSFFKRNPWVKYALIGAAVALVVIGLGFAAAATFGVLPAVLGVGATVGGVVGFTGAAATGVGLAAIGAGFTALVVGVATGIGKFRDWVVGRKRKAAHENVVAEQDRQVENQASVQRKKSQPEQRKSSVVFPEPNSSPTLFHHPAAQPAQEPEAKKGHHRKLSRSSSDSE